MIVVIGRPAVDDEGRLRGRAALIALAAAERGGTVELVGSLGDDSDGDAATLALGRVGIGHAALLRDPAGATPRAGDRAGQPAGAPLPRLDARDVELGLNYLPECQVLIVADTLEPEALGVAVASARYHGAKLIVLAEQGTEPGAEQGAEPGPQQGAEQGAEQGARQPNGLPSDATVLAAPAEESGAFGVLVAAYALALVADTGAREAWQDALAESGWEPG